MPNYDRTIDATLAKPRPGKTSTPQAVVDPVSVGLELSEIEYRPASWFRENPANAVFRDLKSSAYLDELEADIRANGITDNLVAMPDGLIISGESRVIVARRIDPASRLPVRIVLSEISTEEQKRRLYLSNLLRFEIPEDARLLLGREVGLYTDMTRDEAAETTGKSRRQVQRDAALVKEAEDIAAGKGKAAPDLEDVGEARDRVQSARREKKPSTGNNKVITLLLPILADMDDEGGVCAEYADKIRRVLG